MENEEYKTPASKSDYAAQVGQEEVLTRLTENPGEDRQKAYEKSKKLYTAYIKSGPDWVRENALRDPVLYDALRRAAYSGVEVEDIGWFLAGLFYEQHKEISKRHINRSLQTPDTSSLELPDLICKSAVHDQLRSN